MKTINISNPPGQMLRLLEQAEREDLILRLPDGREFMLVAVDEFDVEVAKTRQNQELMEFLDRRAASKATVPLDQVKRELGME